MTKNRQIQILYQSESNDSGKIASFLMREALAMKSVGFLVGTQPIEEAQQILYRGSTMWQETDYPRNQRMIQGWKEYSHTLFLSLYYPFIEDITIPTFFCEHLDDNTIREINRRKWEKAFIKNDVSALVSYGKDLSIWPLTSFEQMLKQFNKMPQTSLFAVRKHINIPLYSEERYWVLNGQIYHKSGIIPEIVHEAVGRLKPIGSQYYTIDATSDFIVEINPGESSDRYFENSPTFFAKWFADAF